MNREQQRAIQHKEGPLLVIAGAGSGKTRIVTHRIARLLEEGVSPSRILGLTFTNKAADEMKKRVEAVVGKRVLISTFHSLGALILRESIQALGYSRHFSIYDQEDAEKLLKSCLGALPLNEKKKSLKLFLSAISFAKNALLSPSDLASSSPEGPLAADIYALYQARLKESNAVDFDDLLFLPVSLFRKEPSLLESYQKRWPYILVDEYQDTNTAQYALVKLLSEKSGNLFVVGDPDQSIYSWRGAKIENILNFEKDFPGAEIVRLEQNYRSRNRILEAANALISCNCNRYHKRLWSDRGEGEKIELYLAEDEEGEAEFVVEGVEDYQMKGAPLSEIAVFYRTNFQSRVLEDAFLAAKIPYTLVGGISFYQRKEIKDLLALLRMAVSGSDFVAFQRTFSLEKRGIGQATLEKMRLASLAEELPIFDYALALAREEPLKHPLRLNRTQKTELVNYTRMITELKERAASSSISETVKAAISLSDYEALLQRDPESYSERRENIFELMAKAIEWEGRREKPELTEFLGELTLKSSLDQVGQEADSVRLMTLHHGKGLEFDAVFLVGLEEDLFPHFNSKASQEGLEEERRLFYVGMTRAKERLYLSFAARRLLWGSWRPMEPSRFIRELPRELLRFR